MAKKNPVRMAYFSFSFQNRKTQTSQTYHNNKVYVYAWDMYVMHDTRYISTYHMMDDGVFDIFFGRGRYEKIQFCLAD